MERTIVVGGEALVDLVYGDGPALDAHSGGGPFNTARALARLGQPVRYLGRLSRDKFGARMRAQLGEDGVLLDAVVETEAPTTLALAELDAAGAAQYRFYTDGTSAPGLEPQDALAAVSAPDVAYVHVGTLGLVLEPMASALAAAAEAAASHALVMVDPNIRPAVLPSREAYRERLDGVLAATHLVKVSEEDILWLVPGEDPVDGARSLLELGPTAVLVTRGGEGAWVVTASSADPVEAPRVEVVDTIGAGDSFSGGFLARWRERGHGVEQLADTDALHDATRFGCLVAAKACERAGADPPRADELSEPL